MKTSKTHRQKGQSPHTVSLQQWDADDVWWVGHLRLGYPVISGVIVIPKLSIMRWGIPKRSPPPQHLLLLVRTKWSYPRMEGLGNPSYKNLCLFVSSIITHHHHHMLDAPTWISVRDAFSLSLFLSLTLIYMFLPTAAFAFEMSL